MAKLKYLAVEREVILDLEECDQENRTPLSEFKALPFLETLGFMDGVWKGKPWELDSDAEEAEDGYLEERKVVEVRVEERV